MSDRRAVASLLLAGLAGIGATCASVFVLAPDASVRLPPRSVVVDEAPHDAAALGFGVTQPRRIEVSGMTGRIGSDLDLAVLCGEEPDRALRARLIAAAPPLGLEATFLHARRIPGGIEGTLTLGYDGDGGLLSASFGEDALAPTSQALEAPAYFDALAARLSGGAVGPAEENVIGAARQRLYRRDRDRPGAYVYELGASQWVARRQPRPYFAVALLFDRLLAARRATYAAALAIGALGSLGVLLWRLARRRAGFSSVPWLSGLMLIAMAPGLAGFFGGPALIVVNAIITWLFVGGLVLSLWVAGEAELREALPGALEQMDRVARRRPVRRTGLDLLAGVAVGCVLAGILSMGGAIASLAGGGYGALVADIGEGMIPSTLAMGLLIAAATIFVMGIAARIAGAPGRIAGALLGGVAWSVPSATEPFVAALAIGILASWIAAKLLWRGGALALLAAAITATSLPTLLFALPRASHLPGILALAVAPALLAILGESLRRAAPEAGESAGLAPAYVSRLEHDARLLAEVSLLRQFQLALLPEAEVSRVGGVEIAWRMNPAEAVGGDYVDVLEDSLGRVWIAVGDAAGHGISCSVLTALTKASVLEHACSELGPAEALARIRRLFSRLRRGRNMVTLLLMVWDPATRRLRLSSAGHPPILLHDGSEIREVTAPGRPLGVDLPGADEEIALHLARPSVVVAYSDGVPESLSPDGEPFGYERWRRALSALETYPAPYVLDTLLADVASHRATRPPDDDVTAVVLRIA